ncbi:MAG: hypothetical protein ACI8RZ_004310 [Myxococcota bacterium]|jgi:hypothetical protein
MIWLIPLAAADDTLPEGWRSAPPAVQTFAAQTTFAQYSSCSQSWSHYTAKTAMVLTLKEGGTARGCREKRSDSIDPDSTWRTEDYLGMTGTWSRDGDWINLSLNPASGVCEGENLLSRPNMAGWSLRCTQAIPPAEAGIPGRPLVCRFTTPVYTESLGFEVVGLLPYPGEWIVLGDGTGLSIHQDDTGLFGPMTTTITALQAPPVIGTITGRVPAP